ncbi:class I SAM-dependent methyltransferase [Reyranella aquatilis]|uniref:Class I SAM-dependent methyltransferase n=1 Tax=Reyranella aquatilis TaxID=2035356 RepID=A0ABS8KYN1_9HYPH|nr:class I SAM-dependent methyltransferase [Reyranella aquatilis]MCC8431214.1 class I SAM-dependent methyltransferase [Reyranella aquatilis]
MERAEYELMHAVEDRMWWYRGLRRLASGQLARSLARSGAAGSVLDAGCGTGGMLRLLGPDVAGRPAIGLEYDPVAASMARTKAARPVVSGSVNELPLRDGVLAAYVSLDVLCHANVDPARALKEAHRCLGPGAIAVFNLPAYSWMLSAHDRRVHNARRFTRGEARALVSAHGFRVVRASYWNTLLFPLMLLHRLVERGDAESDVRDYPRWLDAIFSTALAIERAAIGAGLNLPFGGSLMIVAVRDA